MVTPDPDDTADHDALNSVSGDNAGIIIQAGTINGDVTVNDTARTRPGRRLEVFSHGRGRGLLLSHKVRAAATRAGILATSSTDRTHTLWEMSTGLRLHTFRSYSDPTRRYDRTRGMCLSADGALFACEGLRRGSLAVYDTRSGTRLHHLGAVGEPTDTSMTDFVRNLPMANYRAGYFGPNGELAASVEFGRWRVWRIADGAELWSAEEDNITALVFSDDDTLVATASEWSTRTGEFLSDHSVLVHDASTGAMRFELILTPNDTPHMYTRTYLAFSPDSSLLAISGTSGVTVHDAMTGSLVATVGKPGWPAFNDPVTFCGNDLLVLHANLGPRFWDLAAHKGRMHLLNFSDVHATSGDGALVAAYDNRNKEVGVWSTADGHVVERVPAAHVSALHFTADDHLVICGRQNRAELWQIRA